MSFSVPSVGLFRSSDHRYWWMGEPEGGYPGVTGVLRVIDKPAIATWAKTETAKCAMRNWELLSTMRQEGGDAAAVAWLSRIPDYQRDTAGKLGSAVHRLTELADRGQAYELSDEERPIVEAYQRFLADYRPKLISREHAIINRKYGYGGTYDLIFTLGGQTWLADIKTSKGYYAETSLQLAAYANGQFIALEDDPKEYPFPSIDRYAVLHLRPEAYAKGYTLIEYSVGKPEFRAFLAALAMSRWQQTAKPVGEPVVNKWTRQRVPQAEKVPV